LCPIVVRRGDQGSQYECASFERQQRDARGCLRLSSSSVKSLLGAFASVCSFYNVVPFSSTAIYGYTTAAVELYRKIPHVFAFTGGSLVLVHVRHCDLFVTVTRHLVWLWKRDTAFVGRLAEGWGSG
jgi:hypothetical protein